MKRIMVVVAIVMVLTMALSAGTANAAPGWGGDGYGMGMGVGWGGGQQVYIVRAGDTLSAIAFRFGVNPFEIARVNGLFNPNLIFSGQCLIIPEGYRPGPGPCLDRSTIRVDAASSRTGTRVGTTATAVATAAATTATTGAPR